jgi:hypothetical protein
MRYIHTRIDTLKDMEGETLYWRYTLAVILARAIGAPLRYGPTLYATLIVEEMKSNVGELDIQIEGIFIEGKSKQGALPYLESRILLQANDLERHYPRSWAFLQELSFGWEDWRGSSGATGSNSGLKRRRIDEES